MNELSKGLLVPQPISAAVVSPVDDSTKTGSVNGQKSGNSLPLDEKAANIRQSINKNSEDLQRQVTAAVSHMNDFIQSTQRDLSFTYDADRGETVVKVVDRHTQEVIRQIPDAIFLKIAQQLSDELPGALLSAKV